MHDHDHEHGHSHHSSKPFNTAFAIATTLALAFTLAEATYGLIANSMSLLADAAHNLGDGLGLILAWIANWLLTIPAKKRYSYGFKRTTIIAALANAFILIATSALIAYESIYKFFHLTAINEPMVIIVATIGIFVNGGSALLFKQGAHADLNIQGAFWHLMADMFISIGVVVAAIIIMLTGWLWVDPALGLVIVAIVLWGTWSLMRDSFRLIMDAVPHYVDHLGVKEYLSQLPNVEAIHDLHIWGLSTREVALTAHLVMPKQPLTDADLKTINDTLHEKFHIQHVTIQVESGSDNDPCARTEAC
jgi:cobalt-zinc-cadmium efflux system protein